jgi:hypothetical protein
MMRVYNSPQGSEAWLAERAGVITASRYKDARDCSDGLTDQQRIYVSTIRAGLSEADAMTAAGYKKPPTAEAVALALAGKLPPQWGAKATGYAAQVAVERIAGHPIDKLYENWQMREGRDQEPLARAAYDVETGHIVTEVGFVTTDDRQFGYSADGFIGDDGLLEIKTLLSAEVILKVIGSGDLSAYIDQCMGGLWITGRQWLDLVLWAPALEPIDRHLTIHHLTRDEEAIEALESDLLAFARMVGEAEKALRTVPAVMVREPLAA